ncbi:TIGR04283 family arsenosugar biosynthesis glycosyltransferase [Adhaeretor mobilis]|uniref:Glycosyl transferase family 2 n=1 Tax=Adhaeretor mobilis TaxID=1930276 RepID=A0A517N0T5_9BACT|nr:TIGR04283 family arsenosugar biosynthesis glycosyltransferase [Adhaeretor mobilis]QDT00752.1 Glycosyl transferase family 2 [Adhaeretor mobilis]
MLLDTDPYVESIESKADPGLTISVIIPMLNEANNIERSVRSAWAAGASEVLVVDGGSQDRSVQSAEAAGAKVYRSVRGRGAQQNYGATHASGDVLLFLHADNWLAPVCGQQIREALRRSDVIAGAFHQRINSDNWRYRLLEHGNALRARFWGVPYGDQGIFVRRSEFENAGGFPEIALMEDLMLMRTIREIGKVMLLPGPVCVSPRRWEQEGVIRQTLRNWCLIVFRKLGISPNRLAHFYPTHCQETMLTSEVNTPNECRKDINATPQCSASDR